MDSGAHDREPAAGESCEHEWVLAEANLTLRGAQRRLDCTRCWATTYDGGQAALGDRRPGLDFTVDDLPAELRE